MDFFILIENTDDVHFESNAESVMFDNNEISSEENCSTPKEFTAGEAE